MDSATTKPVNENKRQQVAKNDTPNGMLIHGNSFYANAFRELDKMFRESEPLSSDEMKRILTSGTVTYENIMWSQGGDRKPP